MRNALFIFLAAMITAAGTKSQIYVGSNGLTVSGTGTSTEVKLGGALIQHTDIDLNGVYNLNFKNNSSSYLSILSNGKVGIGTSTPNTYSKLDVAGVIRGEQSLYIDRQGGNLSSYFLVVPRGGTEASNFGNPLGNGAVEVAEYGTSGLILGSNSGNIAFGIGNSAAGRIFNTGNWYLGANPTDNGYKLDVNGTARFAGGAQFGGPTYFMNGLNYVGTGFSDMTTPQAMVNFPGDGSIGISTGTPSSIRRFTVAQNGNIGIGTVAPTANFQIAGPAIANRSQGPFQFSITDGTINRFYEVHDVAATRLSLVSPSGAVESSMEGHEGGYNLYTPRSISLETGPGYNLGYNAGYHLFFINGTEVARIAYTGFGIGTTNPTAQLHTSGTVRFAGLTNDNTQSRIVVTDANGNLSYRDASTVSGTSGWAFNGSTVGVLKSIGTTDNFDLPLITNNTEQMRITAAGNVGIGTAVPQGKLAVNGTIFAKKIKVTQLGWSDYVFDKNYPLPSLAAVEQFIQQNKHLPDVPSAAVVEKEGIDLGDNQATLLRKIEELTLYLIEDHKKMEAQQQLLLDQQKKIDALEKKVAKTTHIK